MSVEIIRGTSNKPVASEGLANCLSKQQNLTGHLFIGYPIIGTAEGSHVVDALWISEDKGIVIFDLIEGNDSQNITGFETRQDDSANKLNGRLMSHSELARRRNLLIPIHSVSFAPGLPNVKQFGSDASFPIVNGADQLVETLSSFEWNDKEGEVYEHALSAIQNVSTIRKNTARKFVKQDSRGAKLKTLEESIATLDPWQNMAVIETVEGVQRIRGLAGSGKTIVLALKAAYLHTQHPDWRMAVTFYTRSLKQQFYRLINRFCIAQTGTEPNWENLRIISSWGGAGGVENDGIYYEFCRTHGLEFLNFRAASNRFGNRNAFRRACEIAMQEIDDEKPTYDAILIDEAQDFSTPFLNLCYKFLKQPKRLVFAYDELQSLTEDSLPAPEDIFGKKPDGTPNVEFSPTQEGAPQRDIVLEKCYRNSLPILVTAHALGFGIYRKSPQQGETGLIQMFGNPNLWTDVGYRVKNGLLQEGEYVRLQRTKDSSPSFLQEHSSIDDLVMFKRFDSEDDQADWLANEIRKNLREEELDYDDILVINPEPRSTNAKVGAVRRILFEEGINSHLVGVDSDPNTFFQPDSIAFTGIYRAKGNEAGMVYIINAQDCHSASFNLATIRNRLFTGITRSKAWVRVLGVGDGMQALFDEFEELKEKGFELEFTYPTAEQRKKLRIVHREATDEQIKENDDLQLKFDAFIERVRRGEAHVMDLGEGSLVALREILSQQDADTESD